MSKQEPSESFHSETNIFDPLVYIKEHYCGPDNFIYPQDREVIGWTSDKIHTVFCKGKYRGKTLLGIGTGPVVKDVITASQWFDEVFLTDIAKENVAFLRKWMSGDSNATEALRYQMNEYALKDGDGTSWETKNEEVRLKVKDAIVWDMRKPEMLKGTSLDGVHVDLVVACLTVCTISSAFDDYIGVIGNISDILKPGGHFVIIDVMDQTFYTVGNKNFGLLCVTSEEIKGAFLQNGFEIEHFETHKLITPKTALCDVETVYCVVGKKL